MLTSNVKNYVSIEFNTQKKPHKVVLCYIVTVLGCFLPLCDLYGKILTSKQAIFKIVEKWLPQPSDAEFEMAQYPNMFII